MIVDDDTFLSIPRLYRMLDSYRLDQVRAPSRLFEEAPTNHRLRMPHLMKHKCSVDDQQMYVVCDVIGVVPWSALWLWLHANGRRLRLRHDGGRCGPLEEDADQVSGQCSHATGMRKIFSSFFCLTECRCTGLRAGLYRPRPSRRYAGEHREPRLQLRMRMHPMRSHEHALTHFLTHSLSRTAG